MGKTKGNSKLKVFCVGGRWDGDWLPKDRYEIVYNYEIADMLIFPGGADWNPELYNESRIPGTGVFEDIDERQLIYALSAIEDKKFMVGICRGGQMLSILAGGRLIQHIDHHAGPNHDINTVDGLLLETNSLHHQMMDPYAINVKDYEELAWTTPLSNVYKTDKGEAVFNGIPYRESLEKEPEVLYFNRIGGFAIQGHPEMHMPIATKNWILGQIEQKYEQWQKEQKAELPKYVLARLVHVKKVCYGGMDVVVNNVNKNKQNTKDEKDRNYRPKVTGQWDY